MITSSITEKLKPFYEGPQAMWLGLFVVGSYLLVYSLMSLYGFLYPSDTMDEHSLTPSFTHHNHGKHTTILYPLFGNYIPKSHDKNSIPKTILNIKLVGVLKASKKGLSQVTIQIAGGKEKNYSIGDILPSGAKIVRIYDDGVLLLRNGQVERLSLPVNSLPSSSAPKPLEFES